jgi:hypothetical protein
MKKYFLIILAFLGCRKIDENGYKIYTIKKDHHRSGYRYHTSRSDLIKFKVIFNESAIYTTKDPINQADVNKLYGVSDCGENHMQYSIRFGWRYYNDSLQLLWFKHQHSKFTFGLIKEIDTNQSYNCSIEIKDDSYVLGVDGDYISTDRTCPHNYKRYMLYPYFGGDETAPHDITIRIKN